MDRVLKRPLWRKVLVVAAPTLLVVVVVGVFLMAAARAGATLTMPRASISVGKAEAAVFEDFSPIRATVVARDVISLDASEGGRVKQIFAHSGDLVQAGQALVEFSNPDLQMQVLERQSQQIAAISRLQSELAGLEDARANNTMTMATLSFDLAKLEAEYLKRQALFERGVGTVVERDNAKANLDLKLAMKPLQTQIASRAEAQRQRREPEIQAEMVEARQALAVIRDSLNGLVVKAPADGRLSEFEMTVGERRGKAEVIGKLTLNTGFRLTAPIDPFYLGRVRIGQAAQVTLSVLDGTRDLKAQVTRVDPQVKDGVFRIELDFTAAQPVDLLQGQALDGRVMLGDDKPALVVPAGQWLDATGGNWVMVLDPGGAAAQRRPVKTGKRSDAQVEVLSGLKAGETIITSSYETFDKIQKIEFSK